MHMNIVAEDVYRGPCAAVHVVVLLGGFSLQKA